ncbi:MAG: hypothetical protein AAFR51_09460 [Pseudomonadota bacterium]
MKHAISILMCCTVMVLSGCASGSVFRQLDLEQSDGSIVLDARQRVVANLPGEPWTGDVPPRYIAPERIICPEPSPDVASSLSQALSASLKGIIPDGTQGSAAGSYAATESIAQLGQRLATTQLLRDELADLCRSYANGAISTTNYTLRLAQLDEKMVTLLTAEMIAGSFQRESASISGSIAFAGNAQGTEKSEAEVQAQREAVNSARDDLALAQEEEEIHLSTAPDLEPIPNGASDAESARIDAANQRATARWDARARRLSEQTSARRRALTDAELRYADTGSGGQFGGLPTAGTNAFSEASSWSGNRSRRAAESLVQLQQNYLDRDELGAIVDTCLTRMNEDVLAGYGERNGNSSTQMLRAEINQLEDMVAELEVELDSLQREYEEDFRVFLARRMVGRSLPPALDEVTIIRAEYDQTSPLDEAILDTEKALAIANNRLSARRTGLSGLSQQTLDFNETCQKVMDSFSSQLVKAQNARLELQLKQMEADVQAYRLTAMQEQMRFCSNVLAGGLAPMNAPPMEQQRIVDVCVESLRVGSDPVLGELRSIQSSIEPILPVQEDFAQTAEFVRAYSARAVPLPPANASSSVDYELYSALGRITTNQLNVRTCPSPSCTVKRRLPLNTEIPITARTLNGEWYMISPIGGAQEWIYGVYVEIISSEY